MDEGKVKEILKGLKSEGFGGIEYALDDDSIDEAAKAICALDTEECPECKGDGKFYNGDFSREGGFDDGDCPKCEGTGRIPKSQKPVKLRRLTDEEIYRLNEAEFQSKYGKDTTDLVQVIEQALKEQQ